MGATVDKYMRNFGCHVDCGMTMFKEGIQLITEILNNVPKNREFHWMIYKFKINRLLRKEKRRGNYLEMNYF